MSDSSVGYVLDAGAFIEVEKRNNRVGLLFEELRRERIPLLTSAGVVAQVWRGGNARQVPLAFLLSQVDVADLTLQVAKVLGLILKVSRTRDAVDAHVAYLARERDWPVLTTDPHDIRAIDPSLDIEVL